MRFYQQLGASVMSKSGLAVSSGSINTAVDPTKPPPGSGALPGGFAVEQPSSMVPMLLVLGAVGIGLIWYMRRKKAQET